MRTNNRAEQFNSVVAKVVGGKRINFSLKYSYAARCYAAVVIFNTGLPQYSMYKSILLKSPGHSLKALELKRHLATSKRTETGSKRCRRQLQFGSADGQYGSQCQRPDMTCDDYENAKKLFLSNLQQQYYSASRKCFMAGTAQMLTYCINVQQNIQETP